MGPPGAVGAVLLILGLVLAGYGSLQSVLPTPNNLSVNCNNDGTTISCVAYAYVTNPTNGTVVNPISVWFVVKNSIGQSTYVTNVPANIPAGQSQVVSTPSFKVSYGTYALNVFVLSSSGAPLSGVATIQFSGATTAPFTIYYDTHIALVSVTPAGSSVSSCSTAACGAWEYYKATWDSGTQLSVTMTFDSSQYLASYCTSTGSCSRITSGQAFTLTASPGNQVNIQTNPMTNIYPVILVNGVFGQFTQVSPPNVCLSQVSLTFSSYSCSPTGGFTISYRSGFYWTGNLWSIQGTGISGNTTSPSFTYAQLSPLAKFSNNVASFTLKVADAQTVPYLVIGQPTLSGGGTSNPAPGTYPEKAGASIPVSFTAASGFCFQGWILNGQNVGTANPYTVTMPSTGPTSIQPAVSTQSSNGQCTAPPPPPLAGGGSGPLTVGGLILAGVGGVTMLVDSFGGKGRRRKK